MEVSVVLESNKSTSEQFKVETDKHLGMDQTNNFVLIKLYEYFRNKLDNANYSKDAKNKIMRDVEQCIPERDLFTFMEADDIDVSLPILVRRIAMQAEHRNIIIDEKNLIEYLKCVYNENEKWI